MSKLFGTDGVRGVANTELTVELAFKLGQCGAYALTKEKHHCAKILVGRDTRISGQMLESALVAGICSVGAQAIILGVVPTPAVAYLTKKYNADAGVVISASHNPVEYNGIKFFNNKGYKLRDELEDEIEDMIINGCDELPVPTGDNVGIVENNEQAVKDYINYAVNSIKADLKGLKVVIDCANGAASVTAKQTLEKLGAEVHVIYDKPNGVNINDKCGSTHMESLINYVKQHDVDCGLAFDGDADRCLAVDEKGVFVDGDQIMAICASYMKEKGTLNKDTIVATVMSNLGLHMMGKDENIRIETTKVGDRYVLENMLQNGYNIGGEQSGHIIMLDYNTTGDGLFTALHLLEVIKMKSKPLSELAKIMTVMPQVLINAKVSNQNKYVYEEDEVIVAEIKRIEEQFKDEGRVLIRPSGTEPLVRVMLEGKDKSQLEVEAKKLAQLIESRLNIA